MNILSSCLKTQLCKFNLTPWKQEEEQNADYNLDVRFACKREKQGQMELWKPK